jgi:hypothetical protein
MPESDCAGELGHTVQELADRCRSACESYKSFSEDLVNLIADQQHVLQQHEDLLVRASLELGVCPIGNARLSVSEICNCVAT